MASVQYGLSGSTAKDIAVSIESAIHTGTLRPGDQLPSVRGLATDLGVAPGTVAGAYTALKERGLLQTQGRGGTRVAARAATPVSRTVVLPADPSVHDLSAGQPDPGLLPPLPVLPVGACAAAPTAAMLPEVLDAARTRLRSDGVPAENVTLTAGGLDAVHRVLLAHLRADDLVAVEDPGWPDVLDLVGALGMRAFPLQIDQQGPRPESLAAALRAGARAAVVTTRAQNPTGAVLSSDRAARLREMLAAHQHLVVIEDDHAAELSAGRPEILAGTTSAWAFVRSVSKPYGPDLRLAVVSGDALTINRIDARLQVTSGWISSLLQRTVLALWNDPAVTERLTAAAATYTRRRDLLVAALAAHGLTAQGQSGVNVWLALEEEAGVVERLRAAGWAVAPGERFRQRSGPGIRITVSGLPEDRIQDLAAAVAAAVAPQPNRRYTR